MVWEVGGWLIEVPGRVLKFINYKDSIFLIKITTKLKDVALARFHHS